jgi:hypothetical protein
MSPQRVRSLRLTCDAPKIMLVRETPAHVAHISGRLRIRYAIICNFYPRGFDLFKACGVVIQRMDNKALRLLLIKLLCQWNHFRSDGTTNLVDLLIIFNLKLATQTDRFPLLARKIVWTTYGGSRLNGQDLTYLDYWVRIGKGTIFVGHE